MVGSGLKKLAKENNMTVSKGIAYGALGGFAATLSEGAGYKLIVFSTHFDDPVGRANVMDALATGNIQKAFRVDSYAVKAKTIGIHFLDNPGTMKKIGQFLDWFLPLLRENGASPADICPECGMPVTDGQWCSIDGTAHFFHRPCAARVQRQLEQEHETRLREDNGSYTTGLLGALLGAALGAVIWGIVLNMGYMASLVGLLIGFLAERGYRLLRGRQGKGKVVILILSVIFGVVLGTFLGEALGVYQLIQSGQAGALQVSQIPLLIYAVLVEDAEARQSVMLNILSGLFFAGLGTFSVLRQAGQEVSKTKFITLK